MPDTAQVLKCESLHFNSSALLGTIYEIGHQCTDMKNIKISYYRLLIYLLNGIQVLNLFSY
jgi:hypothetical protein